MGNDQSLQKDLVFIKNLELPFWAIRVIEYMEWNDRKQVPFISKHWNKCSSNALFFQILCRRLSLENAIYIPSSPIYGETWHSMFEDAYKLKNLWQTQSNSSDLTTAEVSRKPVNSNSERSKISVFVKFRPVDILRNRDNLKGGQTNSALSELSPDNNGREVTLPLHQKLAMIRMSHKIKSNKVALRLLTQEGGWFSAKWDALADEADDGVANQENRDEANNAQQSSETDETYRSSNAFTTGEESKSIKYLVESRRREKELAKLRDQERGELLHRKKESSVNKMISKVHAVDPLAGRVVMITPDVGLREFSFDGVLPGTCSQGHAYDVSTKRLVMDLLNGFNATAIVYGQTGSGKTYTMFGRDDASMRGRDKEGKGIVPRVCEEILSAMRQREQASGITSVLSVSYVEIYGDHVSDLLKFGARCGHSKVASQRFVLNGAAEQEVQSMEDIQYVLTRGDEQKKRAATAMNDRSTRAHSLFILTLKQTHASSAVSISTRLFLADLGGSEQVKKSQVATGVSRVGAAEQFSLGFEMADNMREAVYINLGLLALKKCIESLNNRSLHVPFQDSKLTMLLSEGIGGNSKTSVIVCANMDPLQATETIASLRFGERCAMIETSARNNATVLAGVLADLDQRIKSLEDDILKKERWELREDRRADALAEDGTIEKAVGGQEIIKRTVVTGAEEERQLLAQLLIQRQLFTGTLTESESESAFDQASTAASRRERRVMGFGKQYAEIYGFGGGFDESEETLAENSRFINVTDAEQLPTVVRLKKGAKSWATGEAKAESQEEIERKAKKAARSRLAYSGISA